jgi:hypothetical protein
MLRRSFSPEDLTADATREAQVVAAGGKHGSNEGGAIRFALWKSIQVAARARRRWRALRPWSDTIERGRAQERRGEFR